MVISRSEPKWSNKEIIMIQRYKDRVKDLQEITIENSIIEKESNSLNFYNIKRKE